jgi:hypothetical protein
MRQLFVTDFPDRKPLLQPRRPVQLPLALEGFGELREQSAGLLIALGEIHAQEIEWGFTIPCTLRVPLRHFALQTPL